MQGIWLLDSAEAEGDGVRSGGDDHMSNSPKARGLLLSEDGDTFQPTVHTRHVYVHLRRVLPACASCELRHSECLGIRGLRLLVQLQFGLLLKLSLMAASVT